MTAEEHAEKICKAALFLDREGIREFIAAEIRAAVEDDRAQRCTEDLYKGCYQRGKAEAYEDAAKIADEFNATLAFSSDGIMTMDEVTKVRKLQRQQIAEGIHARAKEILK